MIFSSFILLFATVSEVKVLRPARMMVSMTKSIVEKFDDKFEQRNSEICQRNIALNVYDISNGEPGFDFAAEDCKVKIDDKSGFGTYDATISIGASLTEDTQKKQKSFNPIAILTVNQRKILMTTIIISPSNDMHDIQFMLPEGEQDFYKNQKILVGVRLKD